MKKALILFFCFSSLIFSGYAQSDASEYLKKAMQKLESGDCDGAQRMYNVYKELTSESVGYIEKAIQECTRKSKEAEQSNVAPESNVTNTGGMTQTSEMPEAYKQYDISYWEFCYDIKKFQDNPTTGYLLEKSRKVKEAGNWLWFLPVVTAFGVGMGVGLELGEEDPGLACAIIFPTIAASALPTIICYSTASAYKKKAWKVYRKPYDDAVKNMQMKEKHITLQFSPSMGRDWAGVGIRFSF